MPKTASRYQQDLGFTDGIISFSINEFLSIGANPGTVTQNAVGDNSLNFGASQAAKLDLMINKDLILRTGFPEDLQEQFGGTGIAGSAGPQGRPPFTAAQQAAVRSAFKTKGIKYASLALKYLITGAALTAHTCRVDRVQFANNVANAVTSILATGANGLATAVQANPYVTEIPLPGFTGYSVTDLADKWLEVVATTQGGGAYRFYGARLKVEFNYN